jgi:uncharacterized phage protein (TIGR01671 family)
MNRQLKFRIWDKKDKSFLSEEYLKHFKVAIAWDGQNIYQNFICGDKKVDDEVIIQQYTGLKDKNGILIFEGDLVQYNQNSNYDGINFEVTWSDVSFGWVLKSKNGDYLTNMTTPNGPRYNFLEVVGSIFETKKDDNNE